eukprot:TRINITY_DN7118_c0_g2_i3.p1 TRINITY_DN7118_c0_g2~~TRINITY_DN7118_c0_g2_i3.p1  ORF type:complete len:108 (-),score=1.07 TRINITY_DN7118_c0_g2_i3:6-329(-)
MLCQAQVKPGRFHDELGRQVKHNLIWSAGQMQPNKAAKQSEVWLGSGDLAPLVDGLGKTFLIHELRANHVFATREELLSFVESILMEDERHASGRMNPHVLCVDTTA